MAKIDFKEIIGMKSKKKPLNTAKPKISPVKPLKSVKKGINNGNYAQNLLLEVEKEIFEENRQKIEKDRQKTEKKPKKKTLKIPKSEKYDGNIIISEFNIMKFKRCPKCSSRLKKFRVKKDFNTLYQKIKCKNKNCRFEINYQFDIE